MKLIYCSECAAPLNKESDSRYQCPSGHVRWNNPVMCVALVLIQDGAILVSKRACEPSKGMYDLPGGFCDFNESWQSASQRELAEETEMSCNTNVLQIIDCYTDLYDEQESVCDLVVYVPEWSGVPVPHDDSAELVWKPLAFLEDPQFSPNYTNLRQRIQADILRGQAKGTARDT